MNDTINRQDAIRIAEQGQVQGYMWQFEQLVKLPSAERVGHWIFNPIDAIELMFAKPKCSECGFESADGGNYCSNCGARMDSCEQVEIQMIGEDECTLNI